MRCFTPLLIVLVGTVFVQCTSTGKTSWQGSDKEVDPAAVKFRHAWQRLITNTGPGLSITNLTITYPYDGTVFPPEIAAPTFRWTDAKGASKQWLVTFRFGDGQTIVYAMVDKKQWTPDRGIWEIIKARSATHTAQVTVYGVGAKPEVGLTTVGHMRFSMSQDRVDASIFYRQVQLPFTEVFLTHVDENGIDSPPICLSRFNENGYAANVPEFVNIPADAIEKIVMADKSVSVQER